MCVCLCVCQARLPTALPSVRAFQVLSMLDSSQLRRPCNIMLSHHHSVEKCTT
jgi:hypothetical protein